MDDAEQRAFLDEGLDQSQRQRLFETWQRDPDVSAEDIGTRAELQRQLDADESKTFSEIDNDATRRQFTEAYESGEVDSEELGTALNRYDDMDAQAQDGADELLTETGDDGAEFLARADDDTVQRVVTDGGIDSYDETMADLLGDDSVDSAMVNRVDDRISNLNGERAEQAKDLVDEAGVDGVRLIDDLDSSTLSKTLDETDIGTVGTAARKYGDLDASNRQTFRKAYEQLDDRGKRELIDNLGTTEYPSALTTGLERMRSSGGRTIDEFYDFEAGNAVDARRNVLVNVGFDSSSITPGRAYQFSDDVRALESNPNVDDVGAVVDDVGGPEGSVVNVIKGGMFEIRYTKHYIDTSGIPSGATLKMDYNLDGTIDIGDSLDESTKVQIIRDIALPDGTKSDPSAGNTYSSLSSDEQNLYDQTFTEQTQLDSIVVEGPDGGQQWVYYEAKSGVSDSAVETADIQQKLGRAKALVELSKQDKVELDGSTVEINSVEMRLASPKDESDINSNALDVLRNSDGQDSDNDLIRDDIPWADSDSSSASEAIARPPKGVSVTVSTTAVAVGGA